MPLTDNDIQNATVPYGKAQLKLSDGGGLYILVKHSGRYWKLAYRFGGKQKSLSLGVYPVVTLEEARLKREEAKRLLSQSIDPGLVKQQQKKGGQQNIPVVESRTVQSPDIDDVNPTKSPLMIEDTTSLPQSYVTSSGKPNVKPTPERRLAILQVLAKVIGSQSDEKQLQENLEILGFKASFDRLRTDFAWLSEQEVVTIHTNEVWSIALTQYGLDVVHARTWIPGIQQLD